MHYLLKILEDEGCIITPEDKILDFGCGNGSLVQALREDGYDAAGCDLQFKAGSTTSFLEKNGHIHKIQEPGYHLPFDDNTFDYIISETVFEHVQNTDETIAEIKRILKPGGVSLHLLPSKWCPIENHVYVPMGSIWTSYPYLYFWALLGVRKKSQRGLSASEIANRNKTYLNNFTKYLSAGKIRRAFERSFSMVRFVEKSAMRHSPSRITQFLRKILFFIPFLPFLYRHFKAYAVLALK